MNLLKKLYAEEDGSSLVMVVLIIFMFIILADSMMVLSVNNIKSSKQIATVDSQYYDLDKSAEKALIELDTKLQEAEIKTMAYMKESKYKSLDLSDTFKFKNTGNQRFFYSRWKQEVYDKSVVENKIIKGKKKVDQEKYNTLMGTYCTEVFGRVYFTYLQEILDVYNYDNEVNLEGKRVRVGMTFIKNKDYQTVDSSSNWTEFNPTEKDTEINIETKAEDGRKLKAIVAVTVPVYDVIKSREVYESIKGNPIYANAITAGGGINFNSGCKIYGDIYSSNNKGILIKDSIVNIHGNVYSNGDICTASDKEKPSMIVVSEYVKENSIKKSIFQNNIFFDKDIAKNKDIDKYTEDETSKYKNTNIFFIFNDSKGGNVYCNNMIMGNSAVKTSGIYVNRNLATKGSIINDSLYGTTIINIECNYIGINPYKGVGEFGSYIENNIYDLNNINDIYVNGIFIVPGIKPLQTAAGKINSYESISCNFWNNEKFDYIRNAYKAKVQNKDKIQYVDKVLTNDSGKLEGKETLKKGISLIKFKDAKAVKDSFVNYMKSATIIDMDSKIHLDYKDGVEGYSNTSAITSKYAQGKLFMGEAIQNGEIIKNNDSNKKDYENLKDVLKDIFDAKTVHFGTKNKDFTSSVDIDAVCKKSEDEIGIRYLEGKENTIEIVGNQNGIIYSKGNLCIKGTGTFNGSILCEGNVTVDGRIILKYDEDVIKDKLKRYKATRDFFKPGEQGQDILTIESIVTDETVREKKSLNRYKIINWKKKTEK